MASMLESGHEAAFWEKDRKGRVRCTLCPHDCRVPDGAKGACGVRVNRHGTLYTLAYDRVVARHVEPIEKKPLFHFLPGSTAYSIGTVGCNLRCASARTGTSRSGPSASCRTTSSGRPTTIRGSAAPSSRHWASRSPERRFRPRRSFAVQRDPARGPSPTPTPSRRSSSSSHSRRPGWRARRASSTSSYRTGSSARRRCGSSPRCSTA